MLAVLPAAVHPSPASLDCLTHEYGLRDELNTAWAVRLRALGQERRPMLMLEDPGGEPLDRLLGAPIETRRFLNLAISIASALAKLHQQGLIHKDIKRSHILVNCTDEQIRLTGFGIASSLPSERQAPGPPEIDRRKPKQNQASSELPRQPWRRPASSLNV